MAAAFAAAWPEVEAPEAEEVRETLGAGVEARVAGRVVRIGRPSWIMGRDVPDDSTRTTVLVEVDGAVIARAGFGDPLRPEARAAVVALQEAGWKVRILSGDATAVVDHVAGALGLDARESEGGATPERKREAVLDARAHGPVVMVGDGVNDAAAISSATVGIAVRGGAEASMAAADVYLAQGGIAALRDLLDGAHRTTHIIRRNMAIALGKRYLDELASHLHNWHLALADLWHLYSVIACHCGQCCDTSTNVNYFVLQANLYRVKRYRVFSTITGRSKGEYLMVILLSEWIPMFIFC